MRITFFLDSLKKAIRHLYTKEAFVVLVDANERCMAAHVFAYLKWHWPKSLKDFDIDYEYNREGLNGDSKELFYRQSNESEMKWHDIIPDMVVHKRGMPSPGENLCVIEFKKPGRNIGDDIAKLKAMTDQSLAGKFKYAVGFHVIFGAGYDNINITPFLNGIEGKCFKCSDMDNNLEEIVRTVIEGK